LAVNSYRLLETLKPPPDGGGELMGNDGPDDPYSGLLEAVLVQGDVH
jgi:hypothetical protein